MLVRSVLALIVVAYALLRLMDSGLDGDFILSMLLAACIGIPFFVPGIFMFCILAMTRPTIHVSIDDDHVVSVGPKHSQQQIPWSSFAKYGSAIEYTHHFWLECGRGTAWIPKRAFESEDTMDKFRSFVAEKIGNRCKFSGTV